MDLGDLDDATAPDAAAVIRSWADVPAWVDALVAARPFGTVPSLLDRARTESASWGAPELDHALAQHPRIGERTTDPSSAREQSSMRTADDEVARRIADGNAAYEQRFGRVFLVRAAGRTPEELLAELDRRLAGDPAVETQEAAAALADIALHRIRATFAVPLLTTHVLDATTGTPAVGVGLALSTVDGAVVSTGTTDADGRAALGPDVLARTDHVLRFDTGAYFATTGASTFHPFVTVAFSVTGTEHLHVPLLLSPFAYSTYRGS